MKRTPAPISKENLERAGRVWDSLLQRQCAAVLVLTSCYEWRYCELFSMHKWKDLGYELQKKIAGDLADLAALLTGTK